MYKRQVEVPKTKGGLSNPVHSSADIIQGIKDGKAYYAEMPEVKEALKKLGYDGMITQESKFGVNYGVWNKKVIKTKSQLTDIWNKAHKEVKPSVVEPLIEEAKKYKSADEFVKAQQNITAEKGVLYHGSPNKFDNFDLAKSRETNHEYGNGISFTENPNSARKYSLDDDASAKWSRAIAQLF